MEAKVNGQPGTRNRSPRYPAFDLRTAIERAQEFYNSYRFNEAAVEIAIGRWGYSHKSSTGTRCLAAMLYYNLLADKGSGDDRRVFLTELGKDIVVDQRPDSPKRKAAIQKAALAPTIYQELWDEWQPHLPPDDEIAYYLVRKLGFNSDSVNDFIVDFRATVEFAELGQRGVSLGTESDKPGEEEGQGTLFDVLNAHEAPLGTGTPKGMAMAATQPISGDVQVLAIPLFSGKHATLNIPKPLSKKDYDHMKSLIGLMLDGMEDEIVPQPPEDPERDSQH